MLLMTINIEEVTIFIQYQSSEGQEKIMEITVGNIANQRIQN